jgi:antitoxin component HigA of HigAB toxin-antitoxin module
MDIRPIRTDEEHRAALAAIEACWSAPEGTEEGDKLDVLLAPVDIYEARRWPIEIDETFDPIDVLRYAIDELGHTQAELAELLGSRSRACLARLCRRDDPQDRRGVENSSRPSGSSLQNRTSRLTGGRWFNGARGEMP